VSYNVQIVTDAQHNLIVDFDVTNDINDQKQLSNMAIKAKNILDVDSIAATADSGYHNEPEIEKCEQQSITCYIPKPKPTSSKRTNDLFTKQDFYYDTPNDCYICPANQTLAYYGQTNWKHRNNKKRSGCRRCNGWLLRSQCMGDKRGNRIIIRGIHEDVVDQMVQRVIKNPDIVKKRKELVEHPFGTIKHWMDQGYFLMRGIENVTGEMSLSALCYNIKRGLNILDVKELIAIALQLSVNFRNNLLLSLKLNQYIYFKLNFLAKLKILIQILVFPTTAKKFT